MSAVKQSLTFISHTSKKNMKFTIVFTVLALALFANTLSISAYGLKGPIFGIAQSTPQPQVGLEKETQALAEKVPVAENITTPVESQAETLSQSENEYPINLLDSEFLYEAINTEPEAEQQKPDIAID